MEGPAMLARGVVTRSEGGRFWVELDGSEVPCILRNPLKKEYRPGSNLLVAGDEVGVEVLPDGTAAIRTRKARKTAFTRPGFRGQTSVAAANLDRVFIVQAACEPAFNRHMVERYLVTARRGKMSAVVVVNKCDLADEGALLEAVRPLVDRGVYVVLTSAAIGGGLDELRGLLAGRVSAFVGPSGVGKTTLLNALFPGLGQRTEAVNDVTGKGRHTTTASRLFPVPCGGYIADTPGVRQLGLFDGDGDEVDDVFAEMREHATGCKFRDCTHTHEPGCAVKAAVESGDIDLDRYRHYLKLRRKLR